MAARRIIRPMRVWLLVLLMLLMPLRGLVGSAMAGSMPVAPAAAGHDGGQTRMHHGMAEAHHDCDGMQTVSAQPEPAPSGHDSATMAHGCESCPACQACHAPALALDPVAAVAPPLHHASPAGEAPHFASAEPRPGHKPPIS